MKKSILICFLLFSPFSLQADQSNLKVTWFGSTCLSISDGQTSLLFDPFFTRPSLWKVVSFQGLKSDPKIVNKWLSKIEPAQISAIITSHSHYDHVLDLVTVAKMTGAKIYGSESTKNIALGGGVSKLDITTFKGLKQFKVGDFEIFVDSGDHPPHFLGITLASGKIDKPLKENASAFAYKKDKDFSFYIKHPSGNILFHPSGNTAFSANTSRGYKADLVVLGVANRESSQELLERVVIPVGGKTVIPVHFDNIFTSLSKNPKNLFGTNMNEFYKTAKEMVPNVKVQTLNIGETYNFTK